MPTETYYIAHGETSEYRTLQVAEISSAIWRCPHRYILQTSDKVAVESLWLVSEKTSGATEKYPYHRRDTSVIRDNQYIVIYIMILIQ